MDVIQKHAEVQVISDNLSDEDASNYYTLGKIKVDEKEVPDLIADLVLEGVIGTTINIDVLFLHSIDIDQDTFKEMLMKVIESKNRHIDDGKKKVSYEFTDSTFIVRTYYSDEVEQFVVHFIRMENRVHIDRITADRELLLS